MNKVKVEMDTYSLRLVTHVMEALLFRPLPGLDLERLVLVEWWQRACAKHVMLAGATSNTLLKVSLRPSESLAMHRVLLVWPLPSEWDVDRQGLIAQIDPKLIPFQTDRGAIKLLQ